LIIRLTGQGKALQTHVPDASQERRKPEERQPAKENHREGNDIRDSHFC
jgi:hypothetical protein